MYREFLAKNGFSTETGNIYEEFKKTGFKSNSELVTQQMIDALTIYGTPEECKKKLEKFRDTGIDLPIIQFNPIGNAVESFKLVTNTFSGDES